MNWDHLVVDVRDLGTGLGTTAVGYALSGDVEPDLLNAITTPKTQASYLSTGDAIAILGKRGWELVSAFRTQFHDGRHQYTDRYLLKRPRP